MKINVKDIVMNLSAYICTYYEYGCSMIEENHIYGSLYLQHRPKYAIISFTKKGFLSYQRISLQLPHLPLVLDINFDL